MRVISGKAKGRKLKAPTQARPLTDQAKEALFNILSDRIIDSSFLDLFAGSGAVGIEALSRGAYRAVFAELNRKSVGVIRDNLEHTGLAAMAEVYAVEVVKALNLLENKGERFDFIFLGAPYDSPALEKAMYKLGSAAMLTDGGIVIAEHRKQHRIEDSYGMIEKFRDARYGETMLSFYRCVL